ncbi:hypothetical protein SCHPADRAFT_948250 [Schizopora paradoxa]|uniref:Uncharacterized protein n=1 Tax=Schizopora paradoxa TaxID=27342 RepID=A0A0H2QW96_9AGAM|nr:hypothetical protein SCHPADRAFT_948250 [Schizopora paradoxa]
MIPRPVKRAYPSPQSSVRGSSQTPSSLPMRPLTSSVGPTPSQAKRPQPAPYARSREASSHSHFGGTASTQRYSQSGEAFGASSTCSTGPFVWASQVSRDVRTPSDAGPSAGSSHLAHRPMGLSSSPFVPSYPKSTPRAGPTIAENAAGNMALRHRKSQLYKKMNTIVELLYERIQEGRCGGCIALDYPVGTFPETMTSQNHHVKQYKCRIAIGGELVFDDNSDYAAFKKILNFGAQSARDVCYRCLARYDIDGHYVPPGVQKCVYDDVLKPLLYGLFFHPHWRAQIFPRLDPNIGFMDVKAFGTWLFKIQKGSQWLNLYDVIYEFGLERGLVEEIERDT